jgi:hypothetical protein
MITPTKLKDKTVVAVATITILTAVFIAYQNRKNKLDISKLHSIQPSPLGSLLKLSQEEIRRLPYRPDLIPGGRDVDTPYGNCRVYEFGSFDGPKVLLVHGISTPSLSLVPLADELVKRGARVMLFGTKGV